MSDARSILDEVSSETGVYWSEGSKLQVLCDYIDAQMSLDAFEDYIKTRAAEENAECENEV